MKEQKPDADRIVAHLERLKTSAWIGPARKWWPDFVFHFTDVQNAARILQSGKLLARSQRPMTVDGASADVIDHTLDQWKDYVRLYFRPRTPTQYTNEGIRPKSQLKLKAHCPVPVFFGFDAKDILTRKATRFSEGNLAAHSSVGDDASYFEIIPFSKVYHDSWLTPEAKSNITFHRNAEVVVPKELDLDALRFIWCRSAAELQTLEHLVSARAWTKYKKFAHEGKRANLHFCKWTYVESATLEQKRIVFGFNASTLTAGPFAARLDVENQRDGSRYSWENLQFQATQPLTIGIPQIDRPSAYEVRLTLDSALAFAGRFTPKTAPF